MRIFILSLGIRSPLSYIESAETLIPRLFATSSCVFFPLNFTSFLPIAFESISNNKPSPFTHISCFFL